MDQQYLKLTKKSKGVGTTMLFLKIVLAQNQRKALPLSTIVFVLIFTESLWTSTLNNLYIQL